MRAARAMAPLAIAAASLLPLTACSLTTSSTTPASAPMTGPVSTPTSVPVSSTAPASTAAAPSSTAAASSAAPTRSSSPATASSSAASHSATPTVTITPSTSAAGKVLTFGVDGVAVRLPVKSNAVPGAPAGFIDGARAELTKQWARFGNQAGCEQVPVLWVQKISTAGFAAAAYNDDPSQANGSKCQSVGGGAQEFWAVVDGTWKPVIETQDVPTCAQFRQYSFPSSIVGTKCTQDGSVVTYSHS